MSPTTMKNVGLLAALVCLFSAMLAQASLVKRSTDSDDATDQAAIIIPGLVGPTIIGPTVIGPLNTGCLGLPYSYRGFCHYSQCYRVPHYYRHLCVPTHVIPLSQDSDSASATSRPAELNVEDSEEKNRKKREVEQAAEQEDQQQEELTQRRLRCATLGLLPHFLPFCHINQCHRITILWHRTRCLFLSSSDTNENSESHENAESQQEQEGGSRVRRSAADSESLALVVAKPQDNVYQTEREKICLKHPDSYIRHCLKNQCFKIPAANYYHGLCRKANPGVFPQSSMVLPVASTLEAETSDHEEQAHTSDDQEERRRRRRRSAESSFSDRVEQNLSDL